MNASVSRPFSTQHVGGNPVRRWRIFAACIVLGLAAFSSRAPGQSAEALPSPSALKKLSVEELMNIEVTSVSKSPEKLSEAASAIQVITSDDIRRSGATSLPEALRLASNLEVAQIDSRQWAITARGFNNVFADKMLVLIDGRTVYTPLYAGVYWDAQDTLLEDVDRIEVISGPGATQWGANAVNGVINITTKSAKDTQGGLVLGEAGTALRESGGARYGGELAPGVYYRIYGQYSNRGNSVGTRGQDIQDAWRTGQGGFRVDWDAAADNHLTLQGDLYSGSVTRAGPDDIHLSGANVLGRWTHTLDENSDLKLQVYFDHTYRFIPGSFAETLDTYDVDFQHRLQLGGVHDVVWGLGGRLEDDSITNTAALAFLPPHVTLKSFNVFAQDKIALRKDLLHLTLGTKIEHNDNTGFELEPSARLAWTPDKQQTVWAAVSRALRTPSRVDSDLFSPATPPYRIEGGPHVSSETLLAYELGYRVQVAPQLALSLATFYNDYNNLRSLEPLKPPAAFPVEISSGLEGDSVGAELTADWRATSNWRLRAGYTELRVSSQPQPGSPDRSSSRSIAADPNHQFSLHSLLDLSASWDFDSTLRYVGPITNQSVPGYTELDLRLGWRPAPRWELSLDGQNLLHNHHAEFNPPGSRREIERSVSTKASWRF
jgi:iron complex outermembrane receptor protein